METRLVEYTTFGETLLNDDYKDVVASDTLQKHEDEQFGPAQVNPWLEVKTMIITDKMVGTIRVEWDVLTTSATFGSLNHQIRLNGILISEEYKCYSEDWETFSEDITQYWEPGDTLELWMWSSTGWEAAAKNLRIYYDYVNTGEIESPIKYAVVGIVALVALKSLNKK